MKTERYSYDRFIVRSLTYADWTVIHIEITKPIDPINWPEGWEITTSDVSRREDDWSSSTSLIHTATVFSPPFVEIAAKFNPFRNDSWHYSVQDKEELTAQYTRYFASRVKHNSSLNWRGVPNEFRIAKAIAKLKEDEELLREQAIAQAQDRLNDFLRRTSDDYNYLLSRCVSREAWDFSSDSAIAELDAQITEIRKQLDTLNDRADTLKKNKIGKFCRTQLDLPEEMRLRIPDLLDSGFSVYCF